MISPITGWAVQQLANLYKIPGLATLFSSYNMVDYYTLSSSC